jgi:hypothetical protein
MSHFQSCWTTSLASGLCSTPSAHLLGGHHISSTEATHGLVTAALNGISRDSSSSAHLTPPGSSRLTCRSGSNVPPHGSFPEHPERNTAPATPHPNSSPHFLTFTTEGRHASASPACLWLEYKLHVTKDAKASLICP